MKSFQLVIASVLEDSWTDLAIFFSYIRIVQNKIFMKSEIEKVVRKIGKLESALPILSHWLYNLTDYNIT